MAIQDLQGLQRQAKMELERLNFAMSDVRFRIDTLRRCPTSIEPHVYGNSITVLEEVLTELTSESQEWSIKLEGVSEILTQLGH